MAEPMEKFAGFPPGKTRLVRVPATFITEVLPQLDSVDEVKLVLFCFWALEQREGRFRYLRRADFETPENPVADEEQRALALARLTRREVLLAATVESVNGREMLYFLNSPHGRQAVTMIAAGEWTPGDAARPVELLPERPTIYDLYEQNIGLLTPMIADELRDAAETYPAVWIAEAIQLAVERNARNWRYTRAILERWHKEGKDDGPRAGGGIAGSDSEASRRKHVSGKYADFFES
ncbi:MAG: DnaD domain protein [Anaerolineae bacterium]|nr:DnaD domain protein [Anaerolineae bacterium]